MNDVTVIREAVLSYRRPQPLPKPVQSPVDAADFIRSVIGGDCREHFVAVFLDGRHRPIGYQIVSVGSANQSLVHPREVFQPAVALGACGVIVAHNHPSGEASVSTEDETVTRRLFRCGELLGIKLLDSMVVTDTEVVSLRDHYASLFRKGKGGPEQW